MNVGNKKAITIVDDEEDIVTLFTEVLNEYGYNTVGFTNPIVALDYIHKYPDKLI